MKSASPLMRRVAAAVSPAATIEHGGGAESVARDEMLLREMLKPTAPEEMVRLWVNDPCLVTTRRLANYPQFEIARAISQGAGWPVHVRASGGSTVVHRPGVLNVSLLRRTHQGPLRIEDYYAPLTRRLIAALSVLGVHAQTGKRDGSYCDGAYNILAGGRKIAGTSCRIVRSGETLAVLAHAVLWVEGDVAQDIAAIARFEAALGLKPDYDLSAHATVQATLDRLSGNQPVNRHAQKAPENTVAN
jgi:octanoyl-[GcvH]:protein N-octanoyltransferase